jgi:hypothetical protein
MKLHSTLNPMNETQSKEQLLVASRGNMVELYPFTYVLILPKFFVEYKLH